MSATNGEAPKVAPDEASMKTTPISKQKELSVSNSTEASATRAITVPFHGASLRVVEHDGQPYTPMRPIVEGMGLTWPSQYRKLAANKARWGISVMGTPLQQGVSIMETPMGGLQQMLAMLLRKLPGWLASLEPSRIKSLEVRARVIQYQNECDDALWQYWNEGAAFNPRAFSVNPDDELTQGEQDTLRTLLQSAAERLPKAQRGKFMMQGWSKLKSHFKVGYREIPRGEFSAAVSIVTRHTVEWEVVEEAPAEVKPFFNPGTITVDRAKLTAIFLDLGKLRSRLDGLGVLDSDLPPSWWQANAISQ